MNLIVMTGLCFLAHLPWWKGWQSLLSVKKRFVIWLPWWLSDKVSTCQCRRCWRWGSIPGLGRSPGVGNGNLLQHSCLGNPMDRGAWRVTVHGAAKSWIWLSTHTQMFVIKIVDIVLCTIVLFSSCFLVIMHHFVVIQSPCFPRGRNDLLHSWTWVWPHGLFGP